VVADAHQKLAAALAVNRPGSEVAHTVIALPSFSVGETLLSHYADRIPSLEHRYLVALFMVHRIPGVRLVFVGARHPGDQLVEHYLSMVPADAAADARDRFHLLIVDDDSARPVAAKLLDAPEVLAELQVLVGDDPAVIEPWNVDVAEAELSDALGVPINGAAPELRPIAFKSAGRRLMRAAAVPIPVGVEDVRSLDEVVDAALSILDAQPGASGVIVKLDDSGAGDGNIVIDAGALPTDPTARRAHLRETVAAVPEWYRHDLVRGAVVEERVSGSEFTSPSAQIDIQPDGTVVVLSTHEQELGGQDGVVYLGCRFPARAEYAVELARHARAVGRELATAGAVGRAGIDFVAVRDDSGWSVAGIEINLRKGGTTHPFTALRHLTGGRYDADAGTWRLDDGSTRAYVASDNFLDPAWLDLPEGDAIRAVVDAGVSFDPATRTGVVLHMLGGLAIDGRCGVIAIGGTVAHAEELRARTRAALDAAGEQRRTRRTP
jgi:hypothetical protein